MLRGLASYKGHRVQSLHTKPKARSVLVAAKKQFQSARGPTLFCTLG